MARAKTPGANINILYNEESGKKKKSEPKYVDAETDDNLPASIKNCPSCGEQVPSNAKFCPNCGHQF